MAKPTFVDLLQKEKDQRQHYITIGASVIDILWQQSKATWISYGDGCNRFFFAKAKQRKIETYVYELQDKLEHLKVGFDAVANIMQGFYRKLLGPNTSFEDHRAPLNPQVISMGATLTLEQQLALCQPFSNVDIKTTLFSIPNTKSQRPNGFTSGFYKTYLGHNKGSNMSSC